MNVTDKSLLIKPAKKQDNIIKLPFSEDDLLNGLTAHQAHADELAEPFQDEMGGDG